MLQSSLNVQFGETRVDQSQGTLQRKLKNFNMAKNVKYGVKVHCGMKQGLLLTLRREVGDASRSILKVIQK